MNQRKLHVTESLLGQRRTPLVVIAFVLASIGCGGYTISEGDGSSSGSGTVSGGSSSSPIGNLSYSISSAAFAKTSPATSITSLSPTYTGSGSVTYSVSPSLPAGMSIDPSTGVISGAPTADSPAAPNATTYTVTVTNGDGDTDTATIDLVVMQGFVVDDTGDGGDTNTADSTCLAGSGGCTLRAALEEVATEAGDWVITVPDGTYSVGSLITIATGTVSSVHLSGQTRAGTIVDGGSANGILATGSGSLNLSVSNLTLQNGSVATDGGAINFPALGQLKIHNALIKGNQATGGATGAVGIGNSSATLVITSSRFENNSSTNHAGAIGYIGATSGSSITGSEFVNNSSGGSHQGGAIYGGLNIDSSTFTSNTSSLGGAVRFPTSASGTYTINNSTFTSNNASSGGALYFQTNTVTVTNSTFDSNIATTNGGAMIVSQSSNVTLRNSTFFTNKANTTGGAININNAGTSLTMEHCTFADNQSDTDNSGGELGGAFFVTAGTVSVSDSVFDGNASFSTADTCSGTVTSNDYNVYNSAAGACWVDAANDQGVASVGLAASLADNGGTVQTIALQAGSAAIDNRPTTCTLSTDARGVSRPQNSDCDSGAYEVQ
ncbi:MAG: hypothetical protein CL678_17260 [Bdellovibrionaceae bacterium]|nr:hypothetical protein [Pseudobdellovibrionaceae bacterium]